MDTTQQVEELFENLESSSQWYSQVEEFSFSKTHGGSGWIWVCDDRVISKKIAQFEACNNFECIQPTAFATRKAAAEHVDALFGTNIAQGGFYKRQKFYSFLPKASSPSKEKITLAKEKNGWLVLFSYQGLLKKGAKPLEFKTRRKALEYLVKNWPAFV